MKTLYLVPWYACNLRCPHCRVSKRDFKVDFKAFMSSLRNINKEDYDNVVLFGGEPTLQWSEFCEILDLNCVNSVSTNMVVYPTTFVNSEFSQVLKAKNVSIATSWNPKRFNTPALNDLWYQNIKVLRKNDIDVLVMITLTEDLITAPFDEIMFNLGRMEGSGVKKFLFEPYIGLKECNEKADEWLCEFHDMYPGTMENLIEQRLDKWNCDCSEVYTLEPTGELRKGCPDYFEMNELTFNNECISCKYNDKCRPCMLQRSCSYPKKLAEKLKNESL